MRKSSVPYVPFDCSVRVLNERRGVPQKPFALYAVLFTWYEEDIIAACVKNLFAEGVDRVFLIDNGSPDKTVELAVLGGALHVETVVSEHFSEELKCGKVFALTRRILAEEGRERSWWPFCDADEFPTSPDRGAIREYLADLDDAVHVVGGHFIAHYPLEKPHYLSGFHPADFQFRATPQDDLAVYCDLIHDKHNLIRFDNGAFDVKIHGGYHRFQSDGVLSEAHTGLCIHHCQFRSENHALKRLKALVGVDEQGCSRLGDAEYNKKLSNSVSVPLGWYVERYTKARKLYDKKIHFEQPPTAWRKVMRHVNGTEHMFNRWYDEKRLLRAVREFAPDEAGTWHLNWAMTYKDGQSFLNLYESFADKRRLEHACYAAQCYAALGEHEKALRTLFAARDYPAAWRQPEYDAEAATTRIKRIIAGEAAPEIPY
jgi:hypothetical protein